MWKKIHSNRDPKNTLFSELQKEFLPYFYTIRHRASIVLSAHPRTMFSGMTILLLASIVPSFTIFRSHEKIPFKSKTAYSSPAESGTSAILHTADMLKETFRLKNTIDSLTSQEHLSSTDSLLLESALEHLQQIH